MHYLHNPTASHVFFCQYIFAYNCAHALGRKCLLFLFKCFFKLFYLLTTSHYQAWSLFLIVYCKISSNHHIYYFFIYLMYFFNNEKFSLKTLMWEYSRFYHTFSVGLSSFTANSCKYTIYGMTDMREYYGLKRILLYSMCYYYNPMDLFYKPLKNFIVNKQKRLG